MFITSAIIAFAAVVVWRRLFAGYAAAPAGIANLNRAEAAIVSAIGDAMFPAGGQPPQSAIDANVLEYIDRYITWHSPSTRFLMHALFYLMEHATLFFGPSRKRLTSLEPAARELYLAGWETSRLYLRRMVFQSLRALMCLGYLGSPEVERSIGLLRSQRCIDHAVLK